MTMLDVGDYRVPMDVLWMTLRGYGDRHPDSWGTRLRVINFVRKIFWNKYLRRGSRLSASQGRPVNVKHDARCVMGKL